MSETTGQRIVRESIDSRYRDVFNWNRLAERIDAALAEARRDTMSELLPVERRGLHPYTSTACMHGLHARCRLSCKFCGAPCMCECHAAKAEGKRP
jgi:hypothetical protein